MRIAFYAPLKPPDHPVPSGDRRMAGLLIAALEAAGHEPAVVSRLRSYEGDGDVERQAQIRADGNAEAAALAERFAAVPPGERPGAWFTYHLYHKAPDWLGPTVSAALGIPYLVAEASFAPKRAGGPWDAGHGAVADAIARAAAVLAVTEDDVECLRPLVATPERLLRLAPFLDPAPYIAARDARDATRARLAAAHGLDGDAPWLLSVAMMRPGDKLESYRGLGAALASLGDCGWRLLVVGDGPARPQVEAALGGLGEGRVAYAGEQPQDALAGYYAAADVLAWPAVEEAYGMALLEAQAAGLPVVAGRVRGVADVVRDGETGLLADDADGFATALRRVLGDAALRHRLGAAAAANVAARHGLETAATTLKRALAVAGAGAGP